MDKIFPEITHHLAPECNEQVTTMEVIPEINIISAGSAPSLGTSICCECGQQTHPQKQKQKIPNPPHPPNKQTNKWNSSTMNTHMDHVQIQKANLPLLYCIHFHDVHFVFHLLSSY